MNDDEMWALINALVFVVNVIAMAVACWLSTRSLRKGARDAAAGGDRP